MQWCRWRELMKICNDLDIVVLLRAHIPKERQYLVDRAIWLARAIERVHEGRHDESRSLFDIAQD
jgi:hypothetical protein